MESNLPKEPSKNSDLILFQTEDGKSRLEVRFEGKTVWLTQLQMAELFQTSVPNINMHLRNIFAEGELHPEATIKDSLIVQEKGSRKVSREISFYNLDVIISVGYRVKSQRGTQFRIWATERLREYIVKGFTLDDERLKQAGGESILRNCSNVFGTSVPPRRYSGGRCLTFMPPALITIPVLR